MFITKAQFDLSLLDVVDFCAGSEANLDSPLYLSLPSFAIDMTFGGVASAASKCLRDEGLDYLDVADALIEASSLVIPAVGLLMSIKLIRSADKTEAVFNSNMKMAAHEVKEGGGG